MLEVVTAASKTAITTLAAVKTDLKIGNGSEDAYLNGKILQVTDEILDYLNIARASDGTRNLAQETLKETFRASEHHRRFSQVPLLLTYGFGAGHHKLMLSRRPVMSVISITEGSTVLTPDQYEIKQDGTLTRLSNGIPIRWADTTIVVIYIAGWVMPGQSGRNLPYSIEAAAFDYIKMVRAAQTRDPMVKSENIPGVLETEYWVGQLGADGSLPPSVASRLDRYRRVLIGAA